MTIYYINVSCYTLGRVEEEVTGPIFAGSFRIATLEISPLRVSTTCFK